MTVIRSSYSKLYRIWLLNVAAACYYYYLNACAHFPFCLICRVAQKVIRDLAIKKKVEIQYVDKAALERLSGNKPHQVGLRKLTINHTNRDYNDC